MKEDLTTLVFHIDNKQPIELTMLTKSMIGLSNQFNKFNKEKGLSSDAKLYVKEIRKGSVIIELFDIAMISGVIPFAENTNVLIDFAKHLGNVFSYFKGNNDNEKPNLTPNDCDEISNIINPIASDNKANLNFYINGDNNSVIINDNISSLEANAIQNGLKREKEILNQKEIKDIFHKQILILDSASKTEKKNKGIIEAIYKKPLGLIFNNNEDRDNVLKKTDLNPLKYAFVVDVEVEQINNKPCAYRILKYYDDESFEIED